MTRDEAIAKFNTKWWENSTAREIVDFQLFEERLCMPFDKFHAALTEAMGRGVYTHELASSNVENVRAEYRKQRPAPSIEDVINLIPAEKRIVIGVVS